jgi:hypothetical protein
MIHCNIHTYTLLWHQNGNVYCYKRDNGNHGMQSHEHMPVLKKYTLPIFFCTVHVVADSSIFTTFIIALHSANI